MRKIAIVVMMMSMAVSYLSAGAVQEGPMMEEPAGTIVDVAANDDRFSTLVTAVEAAGLVEILSGDGPFTLFAPTDAAFDTLPEGALEGLLADPEALADVLTYHVVPASVPAAEVTNLSNAETVQGQPLVIGSAGGVTINGANVVETDVEASNGVVHVTDAVLLPPSADIVDTAVQAGSFSTLTTALDAAGLVEVLRGEGPFTVFAPTDDAFAKLPEGTVESLLNDIPTLTQILTYHVVPGRVFSGDVATIDSAPSVQGQEIAVSTDMGSVMLNDSATVVATDVLATNGVIHVIDTVILPE